MGVPESKDVTAHGLVIWWFDDLVMGVPE